MKKFIRYLFLAPILLSTVACGNKTEKEETNTEPNQQNEPATPSNNEPAVEPGSLGKIDVVLISGQSNAVGCTHNFYLADTKSIEQFDEYSEGYKDVLISYDCWTKDGFDTGNYTYYSQNSSREKFVPVKLGQGNGPSTFGPEIGIAEALHEKYGNKLFIIKHACGASSLKDEYADKSSLYMYQIFIKYVKDQMGLLVKQGYLPTIKAFCWMQGEGDSYDKSYYGVYQDNLRLFVSNVRSDLRNLAGDKEIPFIDAGISNASVWPHPDKVNDAKREFAKESENNYFIDTIAAGMHTNLEPETADLAHYDSESEILLGHLFAEAFEPFLEPVK